MNSIEKPSAIQCLAWKTGLEAIRSSINFDNFEDFRFDLYKRMPQNSEGVRIRYANLIFLRLFRERNLDGINPKVWRNYQDENILEDLARLTTLEVEPVIAKFVIEHVLILSPGMLIENSSIQDYISSIYGVYKRDAYTRLRTAIIHMGFVSSVRTGLMVQPIPLPDNALLLVLHARLAPTPRIVRISEVLSGVFWKLLGIREESTVRSILQDAASKGLIAKYVLVDQLEQITTRYSYEDFVSQALRI